MQAQFSYYKRRQQLCKTCHTVSPQSQHSLFDLFQTGALSIIQHIKRLKVLLALHVTVYSNQSKNPYLWDPQCRGSHSHISHTNMHACAWIHTLNYEHFVFVVLHKHWNVYLVTTLPPSGNIISHVFFKRQ